jgi:hypothetical protein
MSDEVIVVGVRPASETRRWFYVWMAGACALVAFGGFAPTYWLQLAPGTFIGSPLLHLHAFLFSAWILFFLLQTILAATGRINHHRSWGLLGISLATAMVLVGYATANQVLAKRLAAGFGDRARAFHIASTSMITLFGVLVLAAIAYVRRPEVHKRLMLLATCAMMPPPIARVFFAINTGIAPGHRPGLGPPRSVASVMPSALIADVLILAGMIYDIRRRRRVHPAYVAGGILLLAVQFLRGPVSTTHWWYAIADFLARFGG